jgi:hypothetical protein
MMPGLRYNYSTGFRPFEDLLNSLGVSTYPVSVAPILVRFPIQESDSLFLHLIVAHELGHHVIDQAHLDDTVLQQDPDPTANAATFNQAVAEYEALHTVSTVRARAEIARRLSNWLNELICDAIGLAILGPSYLLTFAAFSTPLAGPEPGPSHPPVMLRLKLLDHLVRAWDWQSTLDARVPTTHQWIAERGARSQEVGLETYYLRLEEILGRLSDTICETVDQALAGSRYTKDAYERHAEQLTTLLEHNVLPAQLEDGSAPNRRAIVLSGWFHAFAKHGDQPSALVDIVADREYQRFLAKALEMSAVLDTWRTL